jgi:hypothetical protein
MPMRTELVLALLMTACDSGPPDPPAACRALAHAWCQRVWSLASQGCADAVGISASFTSEEQCEQLFTFGGKKCDEATCGSLGYSPSHAGACAGAQGSLSCTADIARERVPCASICCELSGSPVSSADECCSGSTHEIAGFSCGSTYYPPETVCD